MPRLWMEAIRCTAAAMECRPDFDREKHHSLAGDGFPRRGVCAQLLELVKREKLQPTPSETSQTPAQSPKRSRKTRPLRLRCQRRRLIRP